MNHDLVRTLVIRRSLRRRVPLAGPGMGFTTEPDGTELITLRLEIDLQSIAEQLGPRAAVSKRKLSQLAAGAIRARVLRQEREA